MGKYSFGVALGVASVSVGTSTPGAGAGGGAISSSSTTTTTTTTTTTSSVGRPLQCALSNCPGWGPGSWSLYSDGFANLEGQRTAGHHPPFAEGDLLVCELE